MMEWHGNAKRLSAKTVIKLWKRKPADVSVPADMTSTMDLI